MLLVDFELVYRFARYLEKLYGLQVGLVLLVVCMVRAYIMLVIRHTWMSKTSHLEDTCHLILLLFSSSRATFGPI